MAVLSDIHDLSQSVVQTGVSWSDYERTLAEIGERPIRVSFLDGVMEITSPLPEHDGIKSAIGDLIACLATEYRIRRKSFGSTTFRREDKSAGAEPDCSFYFGEIDSVRGMKRFDPLVHRAPDLWVVVDLLNSSVPREPIHARLRVAEVWRYSGNRLTVRLLTPKDFTRRA
jgi:Uma2 family endonuclease